MKNFIYFIAVIALSTNMSCKKSTDGNKNVLVEENMQDGAKADSSVSEYTDRYVAEDGSSALVTFKNTGTEKKISINSNNMTINAEQKDLGAKDGVYSDHDYMIVAKNDTITITQGNNVITLKKAGGQQ